MSVKVMGMVWESGLPKNQKMCLLAYADHANDDGTSVYPGEDVMSDKTSDSKGNVRRVTKLLREDGVLIQTKRAYPGQRAEYRIDIDLLAAHIARHSEKAKGAHDGQERRAPTSRKARTTATPNHHEPSENHHLARSASQDAHDAIVFALIAAFGWDRDEIPEAQWGRLHKAAKDLDAIGADPDEIPRRVQVYRVNFRGATLTPNAIATNWADLAAPRSELSKRYVQRASTAAATRAALEEIGDNNE